MGVCNCSMFCCTVLYAHSSIAIILMVVLLYLSSRCLVMVEWLFLEVPWRFLRFVIVVFPDHTYYFLWFVTQTPHNFYGRVFIFGTMIIYGMYLKTTVSDQTPSPWNQRPSSNILMIYLMDCNSNSSFSFWQFVFIVGTIIAYGVQMATNASDHSYDLGVKGQCQIYLKSVLWLVTQTPFIFDLVCLYLA